MSILSDELALPAYAGTTSAAAAELLNAKNIAAKQPIAKQDIKEYLITRGLWLSIKRSASDAAEIARDTLASDPPFDVRKPEILAALTAILSDLVTETTTPEFI